MTARNNFKQRLPKRFRRGSAMPVAMMFVMVVGTVTVVAVGVSQTSDSMVFRGVQKTQATSLAESGVNVLYDKICRDVMANKAPGTTMADMIMNLTYDGKTTGQGTYSARVANLKVDKVSPAPGRPAGSVEYVYTIDIEGKGTAPNGTTSIVMSQFVGRRVLASDTGSEEDTTYKIYPGAIQSNTTVTFKTNGGVRTTDANSQDKEAHIVANQGIVWTPASGNKSTYTAPNIVDIQGHALVASEPTNTFLTYSKGVSGMGNPNGTKNYRTAGPHVNKPATYTAVENEIVGMGSKMNFPSPGQVDAMKADWLAVTQSNPASTKLKASNSKGSLSSSNIPKTSSNQIIISSPAYISADLIVEAGDRLILKPSTTDAPGENVVYVTGDIVNKGHIVNLGVSLVTAKEYSDTETAQYQLEQNGSPYTDLEQIYQNSALISLSLRKDAIGISSNVNSKYGMVYAAQGGIKVTGGLEMNGMLVSGGLTYEDMVRAFSQQILGLFSEGSGGISLGTSLGGGIEVAPKDGSAFTIHYIREAKDFSFPGMSVINPAEILEPFRATRLGNWTIMR